MQDFDALLEKRIKAFVDDLQRLVRQAALAAVSDALGGKALPSAKAAVTRRAQRAKAPGAVAAKGKGGRRSSEEIEEFAERIRKYVEANPGLRIEQVAKAMKLPSKAFARPISKLLAAGKLSKQGERRATAYFPPKAKAAAPKKARRSPAKKKTSRAKK